jgi:ubiquinone/menaquinone biosynthesis C-methylase UbiE
MLADTLPAMTGAPGTPPGSGAVAFDRAAHCYDATRGFPPGVADRVAERIAAAGGLGPASRVLEVGIGTGRIALPLAEQLADPSDPSRGGRVVGVDLSGPMLARLVAKRGPRCVDVLRADAARLPFPDARFDAAVAVHVFHLIPAWRQALAEVGRVLRPAGLLVHGSNRDPDGSSWRTWRRQFGVENVGVPRGALETFPEREGWILAGPPQQLRFRRRLRPRELVDGVTGRFWSMCWRMSDEQIAEAAASLEAELRSEFGDLDREAEIEEGFWVRAYRAPGA